MLGFKNVNAYVEGKGFIKTDIAVENGLIKDIKDIQSIKTELDIEEQKARIAILKKQAEADTNGSTEVSITFATEEEKAWAE